MANLKVTLSEELKLDGQEYGATRSFIIPAIDEAFKRKVPCPASQTTTIAVFAAEVRTSPGAIDVNDARYVRITNLDTTNTMTIACVGASDNFQVVVQPEQSFALGKVDDFMLGETDTTPAFTSFEDLASIQINPGGNAIDVEVFVASA